MDDSLIIDYINYLITDKTAVKLNQLNLISKGKRTPSNLFIAEKNQLQALFNTEYGLVLEDWERIVIKLVEQGYLNENEGIYTGTSVGRTRREAFLTQNSLFTDRLTLEFAQTRKNLWIRFVFVSQIFSENAYRNSRYIPYSNNREEQVKVKQWLKKQVRPVMELREIWATEFTEFMQHLPEQYRQLLLDQMVGYNKEGLTHRQLSEKYELSSSEIAIVMNHLMHQFLITYYDTGTLIGSLMADLHHESHYGLSQSASVTLYLLNRVSNLNAIAQKRQIKLNTVKEHILEIILVTRSLKASAFIPAEVYVTLNFLFEQNPNLTFKEATASLKECEFFWYRLVEIERIGLYK